MTSLSLFSSSWRPPVSELEEGVRGLTLGDVKDETRAVSCKLAMDRAHLKPLVMPIYNSSTYRIDSVDEYLSIIQGVSHTFSLIYFSFLIFFITFYYSRLHNTICSSSRHSINVIEIYIECV